MPLATLRSNMKTYQGQRNLDKTRVSDLVKYQTEQFELYGCYMFPNALIACEVKDQDKWILIDGQHRYNAMKKLEKQSLKAKYSINMPLPSILVEIHVIHVENMTEVRREFIHINRCVPVPVSILSPCDIIKSSSEQIGGMFSKAFLDSKRHLRPRILTHEFNDYLIENHVIEDLNISSTEELNTLILKTNQSIKDMGLDKLLEVLAGNNKKEQEYVKKFWDKCNEGKHLHIGIIKHDMWGIWLNLMFSIKE